MIFPRGSSYRHDSRRLISWRVFARHRAKLDRIQGPQARGARERGPQSFPLFEQIEERIHALRRQNVHDPVDPTTRLLGSALFAGGQYLSQLGGLHHERVTIERLTCGETLEHLDDTVDLVFAKLREAAYDSVEVVGCVASGQGVEQLVD